MKIMIKTLFFIFTLSMNLMAAETIIDLKLIEVTYDIDVNVNNCNFGNQSGIICLAEIINNPINKKSHKLSKFEILNHKPIALERCNALAEVDLISSVKDKVSISFKKKSNDGKLGSLVNGRPCINDLVQKTGGSIHLQARILEARR